MTIDNLLSIRKNLKFELKQIEAEILKELTLWQSKATNGFITQAILQVRQEQSCTLLQAKEKVASFLANQS